MHLEVLSRLSMLLMDDEFRTNLLDAADVTEFLAHIDEAERKKFPEEYGEEKQTQDQPEEGYRVLAVTACPTGIARTYMAAESLEQIRDMVSDQELWKDITESYEKHQELDAKIKKTLSAMEEEGKEPGKMASAWSWMSTEMRMLAKGGDKEAASIVTDGCNMGIKTICGYKNQYSGASKAVMEIADGLTGLEENLRDCMKKFL